MAFLQLLDSIVKAIVLLSLVGVLMIAFRLSLVAGALIAILIMTVAIALSACHVSGKIGREE